MGKDILALQKSYTADFLAQGTFVTKKEILANPLVYKESRYIFCTWGMERFTEQELELALPALQAVLYAAGSVQDFARPFINKGIRIFSAWAANAVPVAEFTVAQIILANKGYFPLIQIYKKLGYGQAIQLAERYQGNYKTKVGILGSGMIGRQVIGLLKAYDLKLLVFDPFLKEEKAKELGVEKASLETVFSTCRVISNHLALNEKTKGMLDYALFSKMQSYTTFINTARGRIVEEEGLKKALKEDPTRYALLDVTDPVEPRDTSDELFTFENILVTPHRAGAYMEEIGRLGSYMVEEYQALLEKKELRYEVTASMLETMA
jgi:phosphoglycerate dehydrogenase-like enzyme